MNILLEELNRDLFKKSEVSGVEPLPVSKVLSPGEDMSRRTSDVTKFFDESGFTYQEFKKILSVELGSIFGIGAPGQKKISKFAEKIRSKDEKGSVEIVYDEYVETFFIYFYYQLFVKLFAQQDAIVLKNKEAIKNAKDIVSKDVPDSLKADMEEGLINMYRSFYSMFASSMGEPTKLKDSSDYSIVARSQYFENFANQNVRLFIDYPLSGFIRGAGSMKTKEFIGSLFDAVASIGTDERSSKQIMSIQMLSGFVEGQTPDFDVTEFQSMLDKYPAFKSGQGPLKFPNDLKPVVSSVVNELSSFDDIEDLGMDWAKGTKWEPYIKMICGIISLEGVSVKVAAAAKTLRKEKSTYRKLLDVGEADGGVYFINNQAFVAAINGVPAFKDTVAGLDRVINGIFPKTQYFQSKDGKQLIEAMFVKYDPKMAATYIENLDGKDKAALSAIMQMTDLITQFGANFSEAVAEINFILFTKDNTSKKESDLSARNQDAVMYAKKNVGDFILNDIRKDLLNTFSPSSIWKAMKEIGTNTADFFKKVFDGPKDLENLKNSFNETFGAEFEFATLNTDRSGKLYLEIDGTPSKRFDNLEQFREYVYNMCISMGSIMYHSKVAFGGDESQKDARYKKYFNTLSWFINALNQYQKGRAVRGEQYPFTYLVTPFLLEVIKYSFRAHVNEIEDVLFEKGMISKELRKKVKDSHDMDSMETEEWKPIVEELTEAIKAYLEKVDIR